MRERHFETLRPDCPVCLLAGASNPLVLATVARSEGDCIIEGMLHCSRHSCRREYPIIDGIPLLIADLRKYVADNMHHLTKRSDLSEQTASLLGDCAGSGSAYDQTRQHLSIYGWGHFGDLAPAGAVAGAEGGGVGPLVQRARELAGAGPAAEPELTLIVGYPENYTENPGQYVEGRHPIIADDIAEWVIRGGGA